MFIGPTENKDKGVGMGVGGAGNKEQHPPLRCHSIADPVDETLW